MVVNETLLVGGPRGRRCEALVLVAVAALLSGCVTVHRDRPSVLVDTHPFVTADEAREYARAGAEPPAAEEGQPPPYAVSDRATAFCVDHVGDLAGFEDEEDEDRVKAFGALLHARLLGLGFEVVEPDPLNEVWDRVFAEAGAIWDPHSGVRDDTAFETTRVAALGALREELGCDFLMVPSVVVVSARWNQGVMKWDGTRHRFTEGWSPGAGAYGWVNALSVHVRVLEMDEGEKVYFGTGGIQPLAEIHGGFWKDEWEDVEADDLLRDDSLNIAAIDRAIRPLSRTAATQDGRVQRRGTSRSQAPGR